MNNIITSAAVGLLRERIAELEQSLTECRHDKAKGMEASLKRIDKLEAKLANQAKTISDYQKAALEASDESS